MTSEPLSAQLERLADAELVARLRNSDFYDDDAAYWLPDAGKADALCEAAADRIEQLSAQIAALKAKETQDGE